MPLHSSSPFLPPNKSGAGAGSRGCIGEYRVLGSGKGTKSSLSAALGRTDEALELLRTVGNEVADVMRQHGWWTPLLTEFSGFTKSGGGRTELLGMNRNRGQVIYLRLRHPVSGPEKRLSDTFLPLEDLLGTMLHELAHNVRGPHDDVFQKTLADLEEEYFESKRRRSGFGGKDYRVGGAAAAPPPTTIKPFQGAGVKLGTAPSNAPGRLLQNNAAHAAELRRNASAPRATDAANANASMTGGKTMAQLAAEAAVRRKAATEKGCASSRTTKEQDSAVQWHEEEEMIHGIRVITIQDDSDDDAEGEARGGAPPTHARGGKRAHQQRVGQKQTRKTSTQPRTGRDNIVVIDDSSDDDVQVL